MFGDCEKTFYFCGVLIYYYTMLDIKNITFAYRRNSPVLSDFSLKIEKSGVYGLLGKNGTGKSTLLYLIAGLLTPGKGEVVFDGENTRRRLPSTLSDLFIVPEEFDLPGVTLDLYVKLYGSLYPRFDRDAMERYLEMFELPSSLQLGQLSMGQKKKAYISFALACNTKLLLMDEPSNGLDIPGKSAFRRVVSAAAADDDRAILISTHQVRDIDRILDHILIMDNNGIILNASAQEIVERLSFGVTTNPAEAAEALYRLPSLEGTAIVERNIAGVDTNLNLETLFGLATEQPRLVSDIFSEPSSAGKPTIIEDC